MEKNAIEGWEHVLHYPVNNLFYRLSRIVPGTPRTRTILILLILGVVPFTVSGQQDPGQSSVIEGFVKDSVSGEALAGAIIHIEGSEEGASADDIGWYRIETNHSFPLTLIISYGGYKPQRVNLSSPPSEPLTIAYSTTVDLDQKIVVVGYGTRKQKDLIGAVSQINPQETSDVPVASFDAQIQGRAPGVQVNTFSGLPGEGVRVIVRGTASINAGNDPLYVIDGVFVNNNSLSTINLGGKRTSPLADINPADIESIEVLKDASAIAIYGSRGANGVILVTTKRGNYNASKPKISFNASYGWQRADPGRLWKLTTGPQHAELVNEQWINSGLDNPALNQNYENRPFRPVDEVINGVAGRGNPEDQETYDRLSRVFRTATVQNYDLNISGGSKNTRYFLSAGYTDQEGILRPMKFERGSFRFNFDTKLRENITFGSVNGLYRSFRQQVRGGAGQEGGHLLAALHAPTYQPIYNEDGTYARPSLYENIDILTNTDLFDINTTSLRYVGSQYLEAELWKDLKFRTSVGFDYNNYVEREFFSDKTIIGGVQNKGGYKGEGITNLLVFQNEQLLSYRKTIGSQHHLNAILGNSIQSIGYRNLSARGNGFPNNQYQQISSASIRTASQSRSESRLASFFGRVNYDFNEKYFLELALRADGSSKFSKENRWGYFPAVGAAWRLKRETLFSDLYFLSDLKLRASVGQSGNQNNIGDYAAMGLWAGNAAYPDNESSGPSPGTAPSQLANPDLRWETTTTYNAGIDAGFFNNRVLVDFNVYYKYTKDVLLSLPVPQSTGYASILANEGEISNRGVELGIFTTNVKRSDFKWTTAFNFARNKSRAEKLVTPLTFEAREYIRTEQGQELQSFWLYNQLYVDPQTGAAVIEDVNNDGRINAQDRQLMGTLLPKFFGGITNTFSYKNFDLGVFFSYQYGNKVFNFNRYILEGGGTRDGSRSMLASQYEDRWTTPGQNTDTPKVTSVGNNYNLEQNSRYLEDGSFIRLKSLTLGYTLPQRLTSRFKIDKMRVFVQGTNLWILTKYTGPDPESSGSSTPNQQGLDTATPPQPQGVQFGLNLQF